MNKNPLVKLDKLIININDMSKLQMHVCVKKDDGTYLYCNQRLALNLGFSSNEQLVGLNDSHFIDKKGCELIRENDISVLERTNGYGVFFEDVVLPEQNKRFEVLSFKLPFKNKAYEKAGILSFSFELTFLNTMLRNRKNYVIGDGSVDKFKISKRETECITYLMQGMTAKQIARQLSLSPRTVEFYIKRLKEKFGCVRTIELISKLALTGLC